MVGTFWGMVSMRGASGAIASLILAVFAPVVAAESWKVTVRGQGESGKGETPVVAEIQAKIPPGDSYIMQPTDPIANAPSLPAHVFQDAGKTYLAFILDAKPGPSPRTFTLQPVKFFKAPSGVELTREDGNYAFRVRGKPLTTYHSELPQKPYFYPLVGPTGASYTRAYPMKPDVAGEDRDHPHQRSFWFTYGDVNGFDFWASDPINKPKANFGSIRETEFQKVVQGAVIGIMRTADDWLGPDGKRVCADERVVRVYDTKSLRILDFDITIKATDGPLTFGDTKEGMFGLRVASSMDVNKKKGGKITNAEGITDDAAWGKASPWVDYVGPVDGKTVGVAILNHPHSFRYPTTWHVRTYGLFAANPFGWHDFGRKESGRYVLEAGASIRFGYRVILHEGDTASAHLVDAFQAYAQPPTVELTAN